MDMNGESKTAWFRVKEKQGMIVHEFSIPLKRTLEAAQGIGAEPGKNIKVGFEWGGLSREMKMELMSQRAAKAGLPQTCSISGCNPEQKDYKKDSVKNTSFNSSRAQTKTRMPKRYSFWVEILLADSGDVSL